ncbi:hypothetical protein [Labrys monachus]|uniref:SMODS and SLOG-associating 2TM effector domain-containing protein n=1 Tax=Labrys monachus TaxID=217067 RepID=A0ABU0FDG8_9HYPH|nr:hypothetical protein [Labrys monachus]MDQ0392649.1 hypothetical protein [Labrys monachus]
MNDNGHSEQQRYWNQLVLVKIVACYVRRYRDEHSQWIRSIGLFKAVATSATIGAWIIWKEYAIVWGVVVGATQVLDAAKDYLPQVKNRHLASEFVSSVEKILIDAEFEWYEIYAGKVPAPDIMERWRRLSRLLHDHETKCFPDGLPVNDKRQSLAEEDAATYFKVQYLVEG